MREAFSRPTLLRISAEPSSGVSGDEAAQPTTGARLAVPSKVSEQEALREIQDVMGEEFTGTKAASGQQILADKIEQLAADTARHVASTRISEPKRNAGLSLVDNALNHPQSVRFRALWFNLAHFGLQGAADGRQSRADEPFLCADCKT